MAKAPTIEDLSARAREAILSNDIIVHDIASQTGQIVRNVARMRWFRLAVMRALASSTRKYSHLAHQIPDA
jgi:hypothetical protein